jgi:hypothetical protein
MRKERQKATTRKHTAKLILLALMLLLYIAIWGIGGRFWASVWRAYHGSDNFVPLPSYHREDYMPADSGEEPRLDPAARRPGESPGQ